MLGLRRAGASAARAAGRAATKHGAEKWCGGRSEVERQRQEARGGGDRYLLSSGWEESDGAGLRREGHDVPQHGAAAACKYPLRWMLMRRS